MFKLYLSALCYSYQYQLLGIVCLTYQPSIAARTGTKREKAIIGDLFTTDGYSWKLKIEKCIVTKNDKSDKKKVLTPTTSINTTGSVAKTQTCRPWPTNFLVDHSTACNKLCSYHRGELKSLRARSVGEVSAYWSCVQFSGYVEKQVRQAQLQLVEKLATPLTKFKLNGSFTTVEM